MKPTLQFTITLGVSPRDIEIALLKHMERYKAEIRDEQLTILERSDIFLIKMVSEFFIKYNIIDESCFHAGLDKLTPTQEVRVENLTSRAFHAIRNLSDMTIYPRS